MSVVDLAGLLARFRRVRQRTEALAALLSPEDQQPQSMPDASPTKWHRAHTTWFFEQFLLGPHGMAPWRYGYAYLFNSYYDGVGARHPRPERGLLTRPSHDEVSAWRAHVDDAVGALLARLEGDALASAAPIVSLGLAHEEQHQELIVTDALHLLSRSPLAPALQAPRPRAAAGPAPTAEWSSHGDGVFVIGRNLDDDDLVFDNEGPAHRVFVEPFELRAALITVREVKAFIDNAGYRTPSLWLAAGFDHVRATGATAPLYWRRRDESGRVVAFTVHGERALDDDDPATHLSYFEADAVARFLGARLPTEQEWEVAHRGVAPAADAQNDVVADLAARGHGAFGVCWQWTQSAYAAYPGFKPAAGVVGEYNGKFMIGQQVLRGASSYTPPGHARLAYRNFWPATTSFQGTGAQIARDVTAKAGRS